MSGARVRFPFEPVSGCPKRKVHLPLQPRSSGTPGRFSHRPDLAQGFFSGTRATPSSAFGRWKVFQLCFTIPAVHIDLILGTEPKTTATFANFQMHAHFHSGFSIEQTPAGPSRCFARGGAKRNSWKDRFLMTCLGDGSLSPRLACKYCIQRANLGKSATAQPWTTLPRAAKAWDDTVGCREASDFPRSPASDRRSHAASHRCRRAIQAIARSRSPNVERWFFSVNRNQWFSSPLFFMRWAKVGKSGS